MIEGTSGRASGVARQNEAKIKATCAAFRKAVIDGGADADTTTFEGLDKTLSGSNTAINVGGCIP